MNEYRTKSNPVTDVLEHSKAIAFLLLFLLLLVSLFTATWPRTPFHGKLLVGQEIPHSIFADFDFSVNDYRKTAEERKKAREQEPDYYRLNSAAVDRAMERFTRFMKELPLQNRPEKNGTTSAASKENQTVKSSPEFSRPVLEFLRSLEENPEQSEKLENLVRQYLNTGILPQEVRDNLKVKSRIVVIDHYGRRHAAVTTAQVLTPRKAGKEIMQEMLEYYDSPDKALIGRTLAELLAGFFADGTMTFDATFTEGKKGVAESAVPSVKRTFRKGDCLIRKKEIVTEEKQEILKIYQMEASKAAQSLQNKMIRLIVKNFALCLALLTSMALYFYYVRPDLCRRNRSIALITLITITALLLNRLGEELFHELRASLDLPPELIYFCLPLGFAALMISTLYGIRSAIVIGLFTTSVASLVQPNPLATLITGLLTTLSCSIAVRRSTEYPRFMTSSFFGVLIPVLASELIYFLRFQKFSLAQPFFGIENPQEYLLSIIITPLIAAAATASLALMVLMLLDKFCSITTQTSLQSCINFNLPLLRRLQKEAPGTYHHSLRVADLAKQAAESAGLNSTLAYACGLYHDIGKLSQPEYFVENSLGVNLHKDLNPTMSAMIILNHVKEGLKIAKQYRLKSVLREAIEQHHGNDLVVFFYSAALKLDPVGVRKEDFRYPHPCPVHKEMGLLMLADCCEAASRSLNNPTPEELKQLIIELFQKKIRSGLLDQSHLTMEELCLIRESFIKQFPTMMHGRIAYPKDKENDENDLFVAAGKKVSPASQA